MDSLPFKRLVHADWSKDEAKRWAAEARKTERGWSVSEPRLVGPIENFVSDLLNGPQPTLAGFDFPIGVPELFGRKTEFNGFMQAIRQFGNGRWSKFYEVCETKSDISLYRPFYPRASSSLARHKHLLDAFDAQSIDDLRRQCERKTDKRSAACSLFWTLGGNQVGKAAIFGWQEVVKPAVEAGALLWPFDGPLDSLVKERKLVICETYPAEAYHHLEVKFGAGQSKRTCDHRVKVTERLAERCNRLGINLTVAMKNTLIDGFGSALNGEDQFDAAMGLLGMVEVVEGRRSEGPADGHIQTWEGWILGQSGTPYTSAISSASGGET